jgi:hypothetical protein
MPVNNREDTASQPGDRLVIEAIDEYCAVVECEQVASHAHRQEDVRVHLEILPRRLQRAAEHPGRAS